MILPTYQLIIALMACRLRVEMIACAIELVFEIGEFIMLLVVTSRVIRNEPFQ